MLKRNSNDKLIFLFFSLNKKLDLKNPFTKRSLCEDGVRVLINRLFNDDDGQAMMINQIQ